MSKPKSIPAIPTVLKEIKKPRKWNRRAVVDQSPDAGQGLGMRKVFDLIDEQKTRYLS